MADLRTVWSDENFDGAIKSNVDSQDEMQLDDMTDVGISSVGKVTVNSLKSVVYSNGITKGIAQTLTKEKSPEVPRGTLRDNKFDEWLVKAKSKNYKNVKLSSKIGTFAGISDLINTSCGLMVGAMGKTATSSFIDDMAVKFAGGIDNKAIQFTAGLGVTGILEKLGGGMDEKLPTAEELTALTLANYYNIYENRPGRYVRDREGKYNYVTGNYSDNINGEKSQNNSDSEIAKKLKSLKAQGEKLSSAIKKINQYGLSMKGVTDFVTDKTKKSIGGDDYKVLEEKDTLIISTQRDEYEGYIGSGSTRSNLFSDTKNTVKKTEVKYVNAFDWLENRQEETNKSITKNFSDRITNAKIYDRVNGSFRNIGCLYIEPYYTPVTVKTEEKVEPLKCFEIPFEFNPKISGDSYEAKYNTEELMGRLLSIRSYVGSDAGNLSIEAEYLALSKNGDVETEKPQPWTNGWMNYWSVKKLEEIEMKYRSLVFPYIDTDERVFSRPPIVRIKLGARNDASENDDANIAYVGDLFKYPIKEKDGCIQVTCSLENFTREKRYIVTNVEISSLNDNWGNNFYVEIGQNKESQGYRRNGFKVNLSLVETTKNFLDIIPNFKQYYNYSNDIKNSANNRIADDKYGQQTVVEGELNLKSIEKINGVTIEKLSQENNNLKESEENFFAYMYNFTEKNKMEKKND